jgi:hypothetical protein
MNNHDDNRRIIVTFAAYIQNYYLWQAARILYSTSQTSVVGQGRLSPRKCLAIMASIAMERYSDLSVTTVSI